MTAKPSIKSELESAQDDLKALQADLPKIEELLQGHTAAADEARVAKADWETQAQLQAKRNGFESVLKQHRADIATAERRVAELQTLSDDEDALLTIAQASAKQAENKAALQKLFAETDAVLVAAIEQARVLATEGNESLRLAGEAVARLNRMEGKPTYERDRIAQEEIYIRAVQGTDIPPLTNSSLDRLQEWPADYGSSPYQVLGHLNPDQTGLTMQRGVPTVADVPEGGPTAQDFVDGLMGQ